MNNTIFDADQRRLALDPTQSFIVQAPAGSGKTELLTQRFLVLLSTVKQPEEIIAITFTKKSAAEMRARIIHALQKANTETRVESEHAKMTQALAKNVLKRSATLQWNLLQNPNRLRIQTIDSFNTYLTRQLPILSRFGAPPDISQHPITLYQQAVDELLTHLEEQVDWSDSIAQLLTHVDNDLNKVRNLLVKMLEKRDQWLPYITLSAHHPALRTQLESHLGGIVSDCLANLKQLIPDHYHHELITLARFAASHVTKIDSTIKHCLDMTTLPGASLNDRTRWHGICELLFTQSGDFRKRITVNEGFPSADQAKNPEEKTCFSEYKKRMLELLNQLNENNAIKSAFAEFIALPDSCYQDIQWQTLESLHYLLRIVVAQLHVIFQEHGQIDFIENAHAALTALGTNDTPTDLSLALDYQIKHILIDEFQDTSNSQFRLLEKLTAGFEPNDDRTLFLVGDPMQSIYRFREADVGLFIRARNKGIGHIRLTPLTLSVNFRSTATVVNWINHHFKAVFPTFEDISMGAVTYSPSVAHQSDSSVDTIVKLHPVSASLEDTQANNIVELIQTLKKEKPDETIAILIRSRNHLTSIIPALKKAMLPYQAIDIDPLINRPIIQDLLSLTRALFNISDRIAWLSILRAPWCGLTLKDLHALSKNSSQKILWEHLNKKEVLQSLSIDGQARLKRVIPIFAAKIANRLREPLHNYIESTWLLLGGPATLKDESDLEDAQEYFRLLDQLDSSYDINNIDTLAESISQLYACPNHHADHSLQIMTIHNAKGLEFDTVILPHLERKSPSNENQLLLWMECTRKNNENALILAPLTAIGREQDPIYHYIKNQHAIKSDYEMSRLLYVAATRAKKRLHLFFSVKHHPDGYAKPHPSSMLEKLWPIIEKQITIDFRPENTAPKIKEKPIKYVARLAIDWLHPLKETDLLFPPAYHNEDTHFIVNDPHKKYMGQVIHEILQQLATHSISFWTTQSRAKKMAYIKQLALRAGIRPTLLPESVSLIHDTLEKTLKDQYGLWILDTHTEGHTELALSTYLNGKSQRIIIDRTFIDANNIRWIIDYKTSTPGSSSTLAEFILHEEKAYLEQLELYRNVFKTIDNREIKIGLYFPVIPHFHEIQSND